MECFNCNGKTKVTDTVAYSGVVYRRRKCLSCGMIFCTMEDVVEDDDKYLKKAFSYKQQRKKV